MKSPQNCLTIEELRLALIAQGWEEKRYDGQEGVFLVRTLPVREMPAMKETATEWEWDADDSFITELCPDGKVQTVQLDSDFQDEAPWDSDEGVWMLEAAGFRFPAKHTDGPKQNT